MIEIISGLVAAILAGIAYIFKTQRDSARRDAEEKRKEAAQAKTIADINQRQAERLVKSAEERQKLNGKVDEIVKRPERDFFE